MVLPERVAVIQSVFSCSIGTVSVLLPQRKVSTAVRELLVRFSSMVAVMVALPSPLVRLSVSQEASLDTVHAPSAVTAMVKFLPLRLSLTAMLMLRSSSRFASARRAMSALSE